MNNILRANVLHILCVNTLRAETSMRANACLRMHSVRAGALRANALHL